MMRLLFLAILYKMNHVTFIGLIMTYIWQILVEHVYSVVLTRIHLSVVQLPQFVSVPIYILV